MGVPFVDVPPFFFFPWTCRRSGVSSPGGGLGPNVIALLWMHSCLVSPDGVTLWTCGSPKDSQHDGLGSVCCLCGNRGRRAHNGYPSGSGRLWDDWSLRFYPFDVFVSLRCSAFETGGLVQHDDTPQ